MRFIHTADWHLGNRMHNIERGEEFGNFLLWLKEQVDKQNAEALIISGDIFDTANPPTEARTQYNRFLASLLKTGCNNVVIVGGNHDSGILLDSQKDLLDLLNIHVVGTIANHTVDDLVFELTDSEGKVIAICAAVPYAHENELRCFFDQECKPEEFGDNAYKELYRQVYEKAVQLRGDKEIPIIGTGHLYAANLEGRFSTAETEVSGDDGRRQLDVVGNLGSIHVGTFPEGFDYVALGHIHYPTMVAKNPKIRYSGSPFILGFDETGIPHCVLSVEVQKGGVPEVEKIEVPKTVEYIRITGDTDRIEKEVLEYVKNPPELETNIEICYNWKEGIDINTFVEDLSDKLPENVSIVHKKRNAEQDVSGTHYSKLDDQDIEELTFEDIFKGLILEKVEIDRTNLTEEEIEKKQNENVAKYLGLLLEAQKDYQGGKRYEDK